MNKLIILLTVMLVNVLVQQLTAQRAFVTTSTSGTVQLQWTPDTLERRTYLVYRKLRNDRSYPSSPMARVGQLSCVQITERLMQDTASARIVRALARVSSSASLLQARSEICELINGNVQDPKYRQLARTAEAHWGVALISGTLYEDRTAIAGQDYEYEIRVATANNIEQVIHPNTTLRITAGSATVYPELRNGQVFSGDGVIQLTWQFTTTGVPCLVSVERSTIPGDWRNAVVRQAMPVRQDTTITRVLLAANTFSYIDFGTTAAPLDIGQTYYYRIRLLAANGAGGPYSATFSGKPVDKTPPSAVQQISGIASKVAGTASITWNKSRFDVNGRKEVMGLYRVYRLPNDAVTYSEGILLGTVLESSVLANENMLTFIDRQPPFDPCRTVSTSYMVVAVDSAGNVSAQSAPVAIRLDDRTPPAKVKELTWESDYNNIQIRWRSVEDCGIQRYNIYRALCDYGTWRPCPEDSDSSQARTYREAREKAIGNSRIRRQRPDTAQGPQSCGGPFMLIGSVDHTTSGLAMSYTDETVPEQSPLCYAYVVSVEDSSGNQSVSFPIPDPVQDIVICARLRDNTPPLAASVARFSHDENRITVRALTVPVQDLKALHLYRTADTTRPYTFVQAMVLDNATMRFNRSDTAYRNPSGFTSCDYIPQRALVESMSAEFTDDSVVPYAPYWYKVVSVDRDGNGSPLELAASMGTYTYGRKDLDSAVVQVSPDSTGNSLVITVSTAASPLSIVSYAVFRSLSEDGQYRQISRELSTSRFIDRSVLRGVRYWYKGIVFFTDQRYTNLSQPVEGELP